MFFGFAVDVGVQVAFVASGAVPTPQDVQLPLPGGATELDPQGVQELLVPVGEKVPAGQVVGHWAESLYCPACGAKHWFRDVAPWLEVRRIPLLPLPHESHLVPRD